MDNTSATDQFQQLLIAAKERRGDLTVDTMVVSSHLAQMRMFILRRGIEFYADQDSYGQRKEFIKRVVDFNMLEMKLDSIVDYFLCDGQGLFYFRPSGDNYQLLYFPKDSYRCYRGQDDEIDHIVMIYSFNVHEPSAMDYYPMEPNGKSGKKKYIKLEVYKDKIEQTISSEKIEFDNENSINRLSLPGESETLTNSLGFIPAIEIFNHMDCTGEHTGTGEFDWLQNQILYHDELTRNIRKNMKFFGNPTLVSSRPKHDIIESGDEQSFRPTISSQAGFYANNRPSTRVSQPFGGASPIDGQIKVPRVIANLEATDRINYLTPDSVSGDQNMYVKQYRSEIRLALGGVDDIDFGTASTAYEMKSMYGRVAATAEKKARALFTYGLCKLFAMMIYNEEELFNISFGAAIGLERPVAPLQEDFQSQEEYEAANEKFMKETQKYMQIRTDEMRARLDEGEMPQGVTGLIPDGNTTVDWRWTGEIFEDDTQDILNNSIVVRNLQELGVDSIEALKYLFPGKTDEERAAMLSGYPFRMVQQTQQSINSFIGLLGNLYQLPHPQMPNMPLAADPNLDITGFLYRSLEFLRKELSYSGRYKPTSSDSTPARLSDADRIRAERGLPTRDEPKPSLPGVTDGPSNNSNGSTGNLPAGAGPAGFGGQPGPGQSVAGGVPGAQRKFEYKQPVPGPGSILGLPDTNATAGSTAQLGFSGQFGDPSSFAEQNINAIRNANPGGPGSDAESAAGSGNRRVSKRRKRS